MLDSLDVVGLLSPRLPYRSPLQAFLISGVTMGGCMSRHSCHQSGILSDIALKSLDHKFTIVFFEGVKLVGMVALVLWRHVSHLKPDIFSHWTIRCCRNEPLCHVEYYYLNIDHFIRLPVRNLLYSIRAFNLLKILNFHGAITFLLFLFIFSMPSTIFLESKNLPV